MSDIDAAHAILGLMRKHGAEGTGTVGNVAFGRVAHKHPNINTQLPKRRDPGIGVDVEDFADGGLP